MEKISAYCKALDVTRQAFYNYIERKDKPWKYQPLMDEKMKIYNEDIYNDTYRQSAFLTVSDIPFCTRDSLTCG